MSSRRAQIKYNALEQQYEALMERLGFLKTEQLIQSDPSMRFSLHKQIEHMQQECDDLEQQLDALEQQLPGADPVVAAITVPAAPPRHQDWGEAPDVSVFHGRSAERATLAQWMSTDRCRLVCILGIGGMGKTLLATVMAQQCQDDFSHLIWCSLRNAPRLDDLLGQWIAFLSNQQQTDLPDTTAERI
ncbi:MAG: hypothetical protein HGA19_22245, partial [Oscillochloris sp.]|nr:hypothetical protein [Oscillochloris sp.]